MSRVSSDLCFGRSGIGARVGLASAEPELGAAVGAFIGAFAWY